MTIEQFNNTTFKIGLKVKYLKTGDVREILAIDFEEQLFGAKCFDCCDCLDWLRCENVEIIE